MYLWKQIKQKNKFPVVNMDNSLSWKNDISHIADKIPRGIEIILRSKYTLSK